MRKSLLLQALPGVALSGLKWRACTMAVPGLQGAVCACWVLWQSGSMALVYWISGICSGPVVSLIYDLLHGGLRADSRGGWVGNLLHLGLMVDLSLGLILASLGIVGVKVGLASAKSAGQRTTKRAQAGFEARRASFDALREACTFDAELSPGQSVRPGAKRL